MGKPKHIWNRKFGIVCRALWPRDTAENLAECVGCTKRMAQYLIDGERKPSARCIQAVVNEILD